MTLGDLVQASLPVLYRFARWHGVELPRRPVTDSDERWRVRVANAIHYALVMGELAWSEQDHERVRQETIGEAG